MTTQRLIELFLARRNTRALMARGAYEYGASHYPVMLTLHAAWLATLWSFGRMNRLRIPYVAVFAVLQCARLWVLRSLGKRWTTRIIILPEARRVVTGPYRFVRHPNYVVVAFELPCVSLALGLRRHAALFAAANIAMLVWRIRAEDLAYAKGGCSDTGGDEPVSRS